MSGEGEVSAFTVERSGSGLVRVVRVTGVLDHAVAEQFEKQLKEALSDGQSSVVVSLAGATFVCSAAWGLMLAETKPLRFLNRAIVLAALPNVLMATYEMLGLKKILQHFATEAEAVAALSKRPG